MYDVAIIGGGPAGLTAAAYCLRKRLDILVIAPELGGKANYRMQISGLEGFEHINGEEIISKFRSQLEYLDFARMRDMVTSIQSQPAGAHEVFLIVTEKGREIVARSVILTTGAVPKRLQVPGESDFLGRGLSYSAVSHAPLFWERETAVVGSDDLALKSAAELAAIASRVVVIAPDPLPETPLKHKLEHTANVTLLEQHKLVAVHGNGYVSGVTIRDAHGREQRLDVTGVFAEMGLIPCSDLVKDLVALNETGHVAIDDRCRTSRAGVFAAGDVTDTYSEQVLIAIGEGAKAALAAYDYLLTLEV